MELIDIDTLIFIIEKDFDIIISEKDAKKCLNLND